MSLFSRALRLRWSTGLSRLWIPHLVGSHLVRNISRLAITLNLILTLTKHNPKHNPASNSLHDADAKQLQYAATALRSAIAATIYVSRSCIEGAGGGLFANKRFEFKEIVAEYAGRKVHRSELSDGLVIKSYMLRSSRGYIDGLDRDGRLLLDTGVELNTHCMTDSDWSRLHGRGVSWLGRSSLARFTNHSNHPNARFKGANIVAKRTITPDEEITINYRP